MVELSKLLIEKAATTDALVLTKIAFAAKRHWKYPEDFYKLWKEELTITEDYISRNIVYKVLFEDFIIGFYAVVENMTDFYSGEVFVPKGFWLEHIFIRPEYHKSGIGRLLTDHVKEILKALDIRYMLIFVDPFARGFYEKIGAEYLYDSKSSIPGRIIPVYKLES